MRNHSRTNSTNGDSFGRLEVITRVGRRRRWSLEEKARSWRRALILRRRPRRWRGARVAREPALRLAPAAATERGVGCGDQWAGVCAGADGGGQRWPDRACRPDGGRIRPGGGAGRRRCGCRRAAAGTRGAAGPGVIAVSPGVQILLAAQPVQLQEGHGWSGGAGAASAAGRPVCRGQVFIFRPKRADRVKILVYDGTGLVLYSKRLEAGRFSGPRRRKVWCA